MFKIKSDFQPSGDQPQAIEKLSQGLNDNKKNQVLLGVTGSGKTFTMAHIIEKTNRPALIMAHNKTLAAQLYNEMKEFFPDNAVEYFVSYYDYYQPEAYIPKSDIYIEKDSAINEQIDLMRHGATRSLIERRDVIVVSSVSCIYGLGSPEWYLKMTIPLKVGDEISQEFLLKQLVEIAYNRNDVNFVRSSFRVRGDIVDIFPSHLEDRAWRLSFFGNELESIDEFDPLTGKKTSEYEKVTIFPSNHYVTPRPTLMQAVDKIKIELKDRIKYYEDHKKFIENQRIRERTEFDIEMIVQTGSCKGIENYSRFLSGRGAGAAPPTLFEYLPKDALLFIDESHVTVPQIGAMYKGDFARKSNLVEYGFRLPSAKDNRPLKFDEWDNMRPQTIFVSATPGKFELELTKGETVQQIIRPTGLTDPEYEIRPATNQVDDLIGECSKITALEKRVLVTTLTKKIAEDLTSYLTELGIKVAYLHSDIHTLERIEIIQKLRTGFYDVLVGVNLLREGIDIPECSLVAILDADKEGFLRSETSLIQTIGRAARNVDGRVILYADKMTDSMKRALNETDRRRKIQKEYNKKHNITPQTIKKHINFNFDIESKDDNNNIKKTNDQTEIFKNPKLKKDPQKYIEELKKQMKSHAENLEFEQASKIRDLIKEIEKDLLI